MPLCTIWSPTLPCFSCSIKIHFIWQPRHLAIQRLRSATSSIKSRRSGQLVLFPSQVFKTIRLRIIAASAIRCISYSEQTRILFIAQNRRRYFHGRNYIENTRAILAIRCSGPLAFINGVTRISGYLQMSVPRRDEPFSLPFCPQLSLPY